MRPPAGIGPVAGKPARVALPERSRQVRVTPRRMPQAIEVSIQFLKDVRSEMNRVAWPERKMVIASSVVVVFVLVVTGAYLAGIDYVFATLLQPIIGR
ncbi:MAG TPA: preprotein translocase subunit SecE [bacterium]|nr:preprotein translocase subunit SecE [bacterium]